MNRSTCLLAQTCLTLLLSAEPLRSSPPDDFPRFKVPGHEKEMATLRDLFWLHYPGAGPKATLWDEWLPDASLWPAVTTEHKSDTMRHSWSDTLTARIMDPEGYVMIRRNDKEVFRRQFDFGRKSAGGLVEGTIEVPSGPATFKAWAIPTNRSFNGYEATDLVVPGGEARTLVLELNSAGKLVVSLR